MKIDEKYSIRNDENNFKLVEIKVFGEESKRAGELREVVQGYYGNLGAALSGYVRNSLRGNLPDEPAEVLKRVDQLERNILHFCKRIAVHKGIDINLEDIESEEVIPELVDSLEPTSDDE